MLKLHTEKLALGNGEALHCTRLWDTPTRALDASTRALCVARHGTERPDLPPGVDPLKFECRERALEVRLNALREELWPHPVRLYRRTPRLNAGQQHDAQAQIEDYLGRMRPAYRNALEHLSRALPEMLPDCRLSVCIPMAAQDEQRFIYRTLSCFAEQTLPSRSYEVIVLANFPAASRHERKGDIAGTLDEIAQVKSDYPEFAPQLHVVPVEIGYGRTATIGFIRSLVTDLALLRLCRRGDMADHLLVCSDADVREIRSEYLAHYLEQARRFPGTACFIGRTQFASEILAADPLLFACDRLSAVVIAAVRRERARTDPLVGSPNFAIRAGSYAQANGYDDLGVMEQSKMLQRLARIGNASGCESLRYLGAASRLLTSARRSLYALDHGINPSTQWSYRVSGFRLNNPSVRGAADNDFLLSGNSLEIDLESLQEVLNGELAQLCYGLSIREGARSRIARRALSFVLGPGNFELIDSTRFKIRALQPFLERFHSYRARALGAESGDT